MHTSRPRPRDLPPAGTIVDYALRERDTFAARALCAVDSLILSWVVYFTPPCDDDSFRTWEGAPLQGFLRPEHYSAMFATLWDAAGCAELLEAVCASPRFRDVRVAGFRERIDDAAPEQFAAMTFIVPGAGIYVAFRGTDTSLAGWREDFTMAYRTPVPAQTSATVYLEEVSARLAGPIRCGGHSKGGNLAVYAASSCAEAVQGRIVRIYTHDGPGFGRAFLTGAGFGRVQGRVEKTLPEASIVGTLFDDAVRCEVVRSTAAGVLQHNPLSWVVEGTRFATVPGISDAARHLDEVFDRWLAGLGPADRKRLVDALFDVLDAAGVERFEEIPATWQKSLPKMLAAAAALDPATREHVGRMLAALVKSSSEVSAETTVRRVQDMIAAVARRLDASGDAVP